MSHFPPLDAKSLDVSQNPKIITRGGLTIATPVNEVKFYRQKSDLIGSKYTPQARSFNLKSLQHQQQLPPQRNGRGVMVNESTPEFTAQIRSHIKLPKLTEEQLLAAATAAVTVRTNSETAFNSQSTTINASSDSNGSSYFKQLQNSNNKRNYLSELNNNSRENARLAVKRNHDTKLPPPQPQSKLDKLFSIVLDHNKSGGGETVSFGGKEKLKKQIKKLNLDLDLDWAKSEADDAKSEDTLLLNNSIQLIREASNLLNKTESILVEEKSLAPNGHENEEEEKEEKSTRVHDKQTLEAIRVTFKPWYVSTLGLTRPNSPAESYKQRYFSVLNDSIKESMLSSLTHETFSSILKLTNRSVLVDKYAGLVERYRLDSEKHYHWSLKKAIIDYVLKDEEEQARLGIKLVYKVRNITEQGLRMKRRVGHIYCANILSKELAR
jgi:hypothetical protein